MHNYRKFINEVNLNDIHDDLTSFSDFDKFRNAMINHKDYESYDFIVVAVEEKFDENDDGSFDRYYKPVTNIMIMTPDKSSYQNIQGMKMRILMAHQGAILVSQWVNKNISEEMIEEIKKDYTSEDGKFYLNTLVNHYKEHTLGDKKFRRM